jgi:hypothetical protein
MKLSRRDGRGQAASGSRSLPAEAGRSVLNIYPIFPLLSEG